MNQAEFDLEVEKAIIRSKALLAKKGIEYSQDRDRLGQFYRAGIAQGIPPTQALMGMAMKHITSIADMVKDPEKFNLKQFNSKITDLRNYTFLLDALLRDIGIE